MEEHYSPNKPDKSAHEQARRWISPRGPVPDPAWFPDPVRAGPGHGWPGKYPWAARRRGFGRGSLLGFAFGTARSAFRRQGEAGDPYFRQWRSLARRHIRSETVPGAAAWQSAADRQPGDRTPDWGSVSIPLHISQVWPERHRGERPISARSRTHR